PADGRVEADGGARQRKRDGHNDDQRAGFHEREHYRSRGERFLNEPFSGGSDLKAFRRRRVSRSSPTAYAVRATAGSSSGQGPSPVRPLPEPTGTRTPLRGIVSEIGCPSGASG